MGLIVVRSSASCAIRSSEEGPPASGHSLKIIGHGVASREAEDSKLKLVAALSKTEKQCKESTHEAQRQLDKKSAAAAAAAEEQQEIENSEEEECWSDEDSE